MSKQGHRNSPFTKIACPQAMPLQYEWLMLRNHLALQQSLMEKPSEIQNLCLNSFLGISTFIKNALNQVSTLTKTVLNQVSSITKNVLDPATTLTQNFLDQAPTPSQNVLDQALALTKNILFQRYVISSLQQGTRSGSPLINVQQSALIAVLP